MKKFSAIFSTLAVALLAIVMMGCPIAYKVGSPYTESPAKVLDNAESGTVGAADYVPADTYTLDYRSVVSAYTGDSTLVPSSVTFGVTAKSSSDWNFGLLSTITGGPYGTSAGNFVCTNRVNSGYNGWWGANLSGYLIFGGTLNTADLTGATAWTATGGSAVDVARGGGLAWSGEVECDVSSSSSSLVVTMNVLAAGSVTIDTVRIDF